LSYNIFTYRELTTIETNFLTTGVTKIIVGKAITNASNQAFNQIRPIPSAKPTLKAEITNDIMLDISNAIKNEKTRGVYFC
jgi:hypothetical protein